MENKRLIMLFGILFSVVFCLMYYVLFSFTLGKANDDKRTLYMNQVGLYEKAQSVQDMQEKLEKEGLKSYTMKQDKLTAVVCGVSSDEKESQQVQQKLKALKYSYIPKDVTVENSDVVKLIDEQAYDKALERIGKCKGIKQGGASKRKGAAARNSGAFQSGAAGSGITQRHAFHVRTGAGR